MMRAMRNQHTYVIGYSKMRNGNALLKNISKFATPHYRLAH